MPGPPGPLSSGALGSAIRRPGAPCLNTIRSKRCLRRQPLTVTTRAGQADSHTGTVTRGDRDLQD